MIKGIIALFTSGLILNPMVLSGIILGIYSMARLKVEQMKLLFGDYRLYVAILLWSFLYTFFFKKIYKDDAVSLDYGEMFLAVAVGVVRFVLACALTISFVIMLFSF